MCLAQQCLGLGSELVLILLLIVSSQWLNGITAETMAPCAGRTQGQGQGQAVSCSGSSSFCLIMGMSPLWLKRVRASEPKAPSSRVIPSGWKISSLLLPYLFI